jgi:hypothetical protein
VMDKLKNATNNDIKAILEIWSWKCIFNWNENGSHGISEGQWQKLFNYRYKWFFLSAQLYNDRIITWNDSRLHARVSLTITIPTNKCSF